MKAEILYEEELTPLIWVRVTKYTVEHKGSPTEKWLELQSGKADFRNSRASFGNQINFPKAIWLAGALKRAAEFAFQYEKEHIQELED